MLKIAPVKEEQMFDNPAIWLYHDVITEKQIQRMKYLAEPKVRALLFNSIKFLSLIYFLFSSLEEQLFEVQSLENTKQLIIELAKGYT